MGKKRVAVLISGTGSNMQALVRATQDANYPAQIVGVISNKESAAGLDFAKKHGIKTAVFPVKPYGSREASDAAITKQLQDWDVELVCLAGFMRILTPEFVEHWQGRMINIHPSLLPKFKGLDTHARAIAAGETEHGCTVHHVIAGLDAGEIIQQARVPVLADDTPQTLAARVLVEEHKIFPAALRQVIES